MLRLLITCTAPVVLTLLLSACGREESEPKAESFLPPPGFRPDPVIGRDLFISHCGRCHGVDARGTDNGPPLIHRIYEPHHHSNYAFYRAIAQGSPQHHWDFGPMPPVQDVGPKEAANIVAYLRQQQHRAGIF